MKVDKDFISTFKSHFRNNYPHISHELSDKQVQKFLEERIKRYDHEIVTVDLLRRLSNDFSDYLLSQGLAEVQL